MVATGQLFGIKRLSLETRDQYEPIAISNGAFSPAHPRIAVVHWIEQARR
jgi:hypothetical protein